MDKMRSAIPNSRFDRPKAGFLLVIGLGVAAYVGLLYITPKPWQTVGILAPFVVILALVVARIMSGHYQYKIERLRREPVSDVLGHSSKAGAGGRVVEPIVKPIYINDSKKGGRHVLR